MLDKDSYINSDSIDNKTLLKAHDFKRDENPFKLNKYDVVYGSLDYEYVKNCIENSSDNNEDRLIGRDMIRNLFFNFYFLFGLEEKNILRVKDLFDICEINTEHGTENNKVLDNIIDDSITDDNIADDDIIDNIILDYKNEGKDCTLDFSVLEDIDEISRLYDEDIVDKVIEKNVQMIEYKNTPKIEQNVDPEAYIKIQRKYKSDKLNKLTELLENQSISEVIRKKRDIVYFCKNNNLNMEMCDLDDLSNSDINNIYNKISESESSDLTTILIIGSINLLEFIAVKVFKIESLNGFTNDEFLKETNKFRTKFKSTVNYIDDKVGNPNRPGMDIIIYIGFRILQRLTMK